MAARKPKQRPPSAPLFLRAIDLFSDQAHPLPTTHPFDLPAIRHLGERRLTSPVTVFVGENGTGKSTLLEAVAVALGFNPEGGSRNVRFETKPTHSGLHEHMRLSRGMTKPRDGYFLRAESYYNLASYIDDLGDGIIQAYGGKSLHAQSHGESFFALFMHRFGDRGLYLLDEPEAALSPQRQLALLVRMHQLVQGGSQFVIATHSPILMAYPGADIWQFGAEGIEHTTAAATEHWQLTKRFLVDPGGFLRELLA